jgi:hypothetical protein
LTGILFVLRSGIPWELLPQALGYGSGMTCWRRLQEWQAQGVWQRIHHELLNWLGQLDELDWSRASLDSGSVAAKRGGPLTGPNPTDRGKAGTNITVVDGATPSEFCSERTGLGLGDSGANSTSAAPRLTDGLLATTGRQRNGALRLHSPARAGGNGRPKPATFFKGRHRRPRGGRVGKQPGARQG